MISTVPCSSSEAPSVTERFSSRPLAFAAQTYASSTTYHAGSISPAASASPPTSVSM